MIMLALKTMKYNIYLCWRWYLIMAIYAIIVVTCYFHSLTDKYSGYNR